MNPPGAIGRLELQEVMTEPAALAEWSIPTVLVGGEHDRLFAPDILEDVAAAIPAHRGGLAVGERIRLPAVDRVAHVRIVGRARRVQVEVPEVHAGRHAADGAHVGIADGVGPVARLAVAARHGRLQPHAQLARRD